MIDQLRAFTYERQRLGQAAPNAARALADVIAVYSSHPSAPLSLHARAKKMTAAQFRKLDVLRLPAMRMSIHLLPAKTAHLAFHATPAPPADRKKRMKHFKFTEKRYEELRRQILKAATEPLTLPELREKVGAEAQEFKGVSAQMTRDGELLRIGAEGLRSNELGYVANELEDADADEALAWLAGEYLRAFGPARVEDFGWWSGATAAEAAAAVGASAPVDLGDGLLLRDVDLAAFEAAEPLPGDTVDLLPLWDAYTMGFAPDGRKRLVAPEHYERAYGGGDGRALVLLGGRAVAAWGLRFAGRRMEVTIDWFEPPKQRVRAAVDERLTALAALLDAASVSLRAGRLEGRGAPAG